MDQTLTLDPELIRRYDKSGPRYTSYPTAVQFHPGFAEAEYKLAAAESNRGGGPLSLYFHLPFCDTVCFYCACNKVVTKDRSRAGPYLQRVQRELALQSALLDAGRPVEQLHWGGGTPTFISHAEMTELMAATRRHFRLLDDDRGEYSIEVDPRETDEGTISLLRGLGFNRMSLGVQDFEPEVQQAVNRIQPEEQTFRVLEEARRVGFRSLGIDLIYGLPRQSVVSFGRTLDKIIAAQPDRLAVFNYAHLPDLFKPQRRINAEELPPPAEKLAILQHTIERLTAAGYVYIGMDHFAKPEDELASAQREGTLYRNFQGYSTRAYCDLVGLGITSIGKVADTYSQNVKGLDEYYARIDAGHLPVFRGVQLCADDVLRREVILQLICHFTLQFSAVEAKHDIDFHGYFRPELEALEPMHADRLLRLDDAGIQVLPAGKLLIRNICMIFDRYLREQAERRYSKVI